MRAGDAQAASQYLREALARFPDDPNLLCLAAQALIATRKLDEARSCIDHALKQHPRFPGGHEAMGDFMLVDGQPATAVKAYEQASRLAPGRPHLDSKLEKARSLAEAGDASGDDNAAFFAAAIARAEQFKQDGEPGKAEQIYRDILKRNPDHPEALRLLAEAAAVHFKYGDAEIFLSRAVEKNPDYARAWLDLSRVQQELGKYADAIHSAEQLVALNPELGEAYVTLGNAHGHANQHDQAIASYRAVLERTPGHPGAFSGLAHQLKTIGRQQEAIAVHRENIAANPRNAEPYWNLANLKTFRFEDEEVAAMEALLKDGTLEEQGVVQVSNALGLEYESRKDYRRAFSHFQRCNQVRRQQERYDPVAHEVQIQKIMEIFTPEFFEARQGLGSDDASPIFIVGLPRSGSTLLEQILASHSQVEGTHELSDLPHLVQAFNRSGRGGPQFPESLLEVPETTWRQLGEGYIERTRKYRSDRPFFIDKNPNNFVYAGLIKLALPGAKIINARRHPLDSCFGSYKQLFASGQPFSYDLMDIGEYYLLYDELMSHWHRVIPGAVLDVQYEDVVQDLDAQVRRLLDYCELPFEESCLSFHETDRAVKTASSEQVRQPIYASSVNLWRRYEPDLAELIDILEPLLTVLPEDDRPKKLA